MTEFTARVVNALVATSGAETAGRVAGRLSALLIFLAMIAAGAVLARSHSTRPSRGRRIAGVAMIVVGGLMLLGGLANAAGSASR